MFARSCDRRDRLHHHPADRVCGFEVAGDCAAARTPSRPNRNQSGRIQEQIDEFLRRAAQRRGGQPPAAEPQPAESLRRTTPRSAAGLASRCRSTWTPATSVAAARRLGGEVAQADQQFTQNVGQAFSGEVSRLASRPGEAAQPLEVVDAEVAGPEYLSRPTLDALPEAGSGLGDLLGSPENIAQAVIMAEILRRPNSFS